MDVTKNTATTTRANTLTTPVSGKCSRKPNNAKAVWPSSTTGPLSDPGSVRSMWMPA